MLSRPTNVGKIIIAIAKTNIALANAAYKDAINLGQHTY